MKLSNGTDLSATLVHDRRPVLKIDLEGCLILSRNDMLFTMTGDAPAVHLCNGVFLGARGKTTRLQRFWYFTKIIWGFSK